MDVIMVKVNTHNLSKNNEIKELGVIMGGVKRDHTLLKGTPTSKYAWSRRALLIFKTIRNGRENNKQNMAES